MKKLMIVCSTSFYDKIPSILDQLKDNYEIIFPNGYGEEDDYNENMTDAEYTEFFSRMFHMSKDKINNTDIVLVLNFNKIKNEKTYNNYIGASTFLEMYEAFMNNKKIYLYNGLPDKDHMLYEEIKGFAPIIINQDLTKIEK